MTWTFSIQKSGWNSGPNVSRAACLHYSLACFVCPFIVLYLNYCLLSVAVILFVFSSAESINLWLLLARKYLKIMNSVFPLIDVEDNQRACGVGCLAVCSLHSSPDIPFVLQMCIAKNSFWCDLLLAHSPFSTTIHIVT